MRSVVVLCGVVLAAGAPARMNVLFLMADQFRWDAAVGTPGLARLAREGLRAEYSLSSTPTCTPARAALLTGQAPWRHGMLGYGSIAPRYPLEFPRVAAEAGFVTASFGKDHFGWNASSDSGIGHGYEQTELYDGLGAWAPGKNHSWTGEWDDYDRWFARELPGKDPQATLDRLDGDGWNGWRGAPYVYPERYHPTAWLGRRAVQFIEQFAQGSRQRPFLAKVSFHRPHSPYDPPSRLLDLVRPEQLPPVALCRAAANNSKAAADASGLGDGWCLKFRGDTALADPPGCGDTPDAWCGRMPEAEAVLARRAYAASVRFVDEQIELIYGALNRTGLLDSTWLLFTSDHGDGQGSHYHWRKGYPYEFSARVPMLLRWPEQWRPTEPIAVQRGATVRPPIVTELRDVFHTVLDAAGLADRVVAPAGHFAAADGKSMLCLLLDPTGQQCNYKLNPGPWRQWIDMEHSTCYNASNHWNGLTDGRTKYVFRAWKGDEQLFDLVADPGETRELSGVGRYQPLLQQWRARLVRQFEAEGRGPDWVRDGKLMVRTNGTTYSPNYPGGHA